LNAALLDRSNEKVLVSFALEHRSKKLNQGRAANRGFRVEPRAISGDPHIEIAAKGRVPALDRRRSFAGAGRAT
jgi:hypothetical protein